MKNTIFRLFCATALSVMIGLVLTPDGLAKNLHEKIKINGKTRKYVLHLPKEFANDRLIPLVVVLHGAFGNAFTVQWDSRMSEQADKDCFIAAYPIGKGTMWNAGNCCGFAERRNIDDVLFVRRLIEKVERERKIDPDRVYVAGVSNGGMLAYRVGCELPDLVAAIAPVDGCMYRAGKVVESPISVIAFNGTSDHIIPYDGSDGVAVGFVKVPTTPVVDTIKFWVEHDRCNPEPTVTVKDNITEELYSNGQEGTAVCLYTVKGGGHSWPGGRCVGSFGDKPSRNINATETMCQFFWAHPKQRSGSATATAQSGVPQ